MCQEAQALNEGGRGDGSETRVSAQLQSQQQALLRRARERLRSCQLTLQEQQAFQDTLQSTWSWLNGAQERLASLDSTVGNKETLEKRLGLVQVGGTKPLLCVSVLLLWSCCDLVISFVIISIICHTTQA